MAGLRVTKKGGWKVKGLLVRWLLLTVAIILTLGLFTFVINALLLLMVSGLVPGFYVYRFWATLFGSLVISVVSWLLSSFKNEKGRIGYIDLKKSNGEIWEWVRG